jgi:CRISPR-associated endonuclease/helicase Cas3
MIDESTESVVVTQYGTEEERQSVRALLDLLRSETPEAGAVLRRLQPYMVAIAHRTAERNRQQGLIDPILPGVNEWLGDYDEVRGLRSEQLGPESLVI